MGVYSTPLADLEARLTYQAADIDGRLLRGAKLEITPREETEGVSDMPCLRLYIPTIRENYRPARYGDGSLTLNVLVATHRDKGNLELMAWVEKLIDAARLKADASGSRSALAGTMRPFDWSATEPFVTGVSLNTHVIISLVTRPRELGLNRT